MTRASTVGWMALWLCACKEPPTTGTGGPPTRVDPPAWVQIDPHPCAMDALGYVTCWSSDLWLDDDRWIRHPVEQPEPADAFYVGGLGQVLATYEHNAPIEVRYCDNPGVLCWPPDDNVRTARSGAALTPGGSVVIWDGTDLDYGFPTDRQWHALSRDFGVVAIDEANGMLHNCRMERPLWYRTEWTLPPDLEFTHTVGSERVSLDCNVGACALATDGTIHCRGVGPIGTAQFDNPPYKFLDGGLTVACAVREDDVIECTDGRIRELGSVRAFSVGAYNYWLDEQRTQLSEGPQICVITTDNAIRCDGTHYPPDLQATLAALPR